MTITNKKYHLKKHKFCPLNQYSTIKRSIRKLEKIKIAIKFKYLGEINAKHP